MSSRTPAESLADRLRLAWQVLLTGEPPPPEPVTAPRVTGQAAGEREALIEALVVVHDQERSRTTRDVIMRALRAAGVEEYDPVGEPFDPRRHIAATRLPVTEAAHRGMIAAVEQTGLRDRDRQIRLPRVLVYADDDAELS